MAKVVGGSVVWDLDVDSSKLKSGLSEAKSDVKTTAEDIEKNVESSAGKIKSSLSKIGDAFKVGGLAATGFLVAVGGIGKAMINIAADFEQNRIAFETMIGNTDTARKTLAELSDFAVKTPFELPQLIESSKSLLAYGVEAENLIPTLRTLGDISAGVGMDKLPQMILAFGQVRAATKLTGAELRQFTEAGVPLLGALVDQMNETGGVMTQVGSLSQKQAQEMAKLTTTIADQEFRMGLLTEAGKDNGVSWEMLNRKYEQNRASLSEFGAVGEAVYAKVKVSAADMIERIRDGAVSFEDVQEALNGMSAEGGRFFNLMEKQSATFGGVMSNIQDQLIRTFAEIAGIDIAAGGVIREGSLFDMIKTGAEAALKALDEFTPKIVLFIQTLTSNKEVLLAVAGAIGGALFLAFGALLISIGPALLILGAFMAGGALLVTLVNRLIERLGGFDEIMKRIQPTLDLISSVFRDTILPQLQVLWTLITSNLVPALQQLWQVIQPVIIPVLKVLGAILGAFLIGIITAFIFALMTIVAAITLVANVVKAKIEAIYEFFKWIYNLLVGNSLIPDLIKRIVDWFKKLPIMIRGALSTIVSTISKPFQDAWGAISKIVDKISKGLKKISPFHKQSPSLVDRVTSGMDIIKNEFGALGDISIPSPTFDSSVAGVITGGDFGDSAGRTVHQDININIESVNDMEDVEAMGRELGFRAGLTVGGILL